MRRLTELAVVHFAVLAVSGLGVMTGRAETLIGTEAYDLGADTHLQGSAATINVGTNGLVTLTMMRTDNGGILELVARENALGYGWPTLSVEAAPVPEPSPAALAAAGFLLLLFRFSGQWTARR
jgi:hypothetical protein